MKFSLRFAAAFAAASLVGCSGGSSFESAPSQDSAKSASFQRSLTNTRVRIIAGINDKPRNPNSPNFAERQAAAHARGLWLTDELNAHELTLLSSPIRTASTRKTDIVAAPRPGQTPSTTFPTYSMPEADATTGYDTEIDFTDGTSMVTDELTDVNGNHYVAVLDDDSCSDDDGGCGETGEIIGYSNAAPTPPPTDEACYMVMDGSGVVQIAESGGCGSFYAASNPFQYIPKWACPYVYGGAGLAAKWGTIAATKNPKAGDIAAVIVGASVAAACQAGK